MTATPSQIATGHRSRLSSIVKCLARSEMDSMRIFAARGVWRWPSQSPALAVVQGDVCCGCGTGFARCVLDGVRDARMIELLASWQPLSKGALRRISLPPDDLSADCKVIGAQHHGHEAYAARRGCIRGITADSGMKRQQTAPHEPLCSLGVRPSKSSFRRVCAFVERTSRPVQYLLLRHWAET